MEDDVRLKIQTLEDQMTKSDLKVARILLSDYPSAGLNSLAEIGERADVSAATVLRFITKLGFDSFPVFQGQLKNELQHSFGSPLERFEKRGVENQVTSPLEHYAEYASHLMRSTAEMVSGYEFGTVSLLLAESKRPTYVIGGRFSRSLAELFCYGYGQVHGEAFLVYNDARSMVETLMDIKRRDIVVIFDFRRYQKRLHPFAERAEEAGAKIILMTDQWRSPIQKIAHHVLTVPVASPTTFDSGLAPLMCIEALIDDISRKVQSPVANRINRFETFYDEFL